MSTSGVLLLEKVQGCCALSFGMLENICLLFLNINSAFSGCRIKSQSFPCKLCTHCLELYLHTHLKKSIVYLLGLVLGDTEKDRKG